MAKTLSGVESLAGAFNDGASLNVNGLLAGMPSSMRRQVVNWHLPSS